MRLREYLLDWFMESRLFEMALDRNKAWIKCDALVPPLTEHTLKVLMAPRSTYVKHWTDEVYSYLQIMNKIKLKPSSKRLSTSTYREWLITGPELSETEILGDARDLQDKYSGENMEIYPGLYADYGRAMERFVLALGAGDIDRDSVVEALRRGKV